MSIYKFTALNAEEYIQLEEGALREIEEYARAGELQYLDSTPIVCDISEEGGIELPDYFCHNDLHIFSERLKNFLVKENVNYIFYKKIVIKGVPRRNMVDYWLAVVPKLDCLDLDASCPKNTIWDCYNGFTPELEVEKLVIFESHLGYYQLFRILGAGSEAVYLSEALYQKIRNIDFEGLVCEAI